MSPNASYSFIVCTFPVTLYCFFPALPQFSHLVLFHPMVLYASNNVWNYLLYILGPIFLQFHKDFYLPAPLPTNSIFTFV